MQIVCGNFPTTQKWLIIVQISDKKYSKRASIKIGQVQLENRAEWINI